jgi:hypothetical protein
LVVIVRLLAAVLLLGMVLLIVVLVGQGVAGARTLVPEAQTTAEQVLPRARPVGVEVATQRPLALEQALREADQVVRQSRTPPLGVGGWAAAESVLQRAAAGRDTPGGQHGRSTLPVPRPGEAWGAKRLEVSGGDPMTDNGVSDGQPQGSDARDPAGLPRGAVLAAGPAAGAPSAADYPSREPKYYGARGAPTGWLGDGTPYWVRWWDRFRMMEFEDGTRMRLYYLGGPPSDEARPGSGDPGENEAGRQPGELGPDDILVPDGRLPDGKAYWNDGNGIIRLEDGTRRLLPDPLASVGRPELPPGVPASDSPGGQPGGESVQTAGPAPKASRIGPIDPDPASHETGGPRVWRGFRLPGGREIPLRQEVEPDGSSVWWEKGSGPTGEPVEGPGGTRVYRQFKLPDGSIIPLETIIGSDGRIEDFREIAPQTPTPATPEQDVPASPPSPTPGGGKDSRLESPQPPEDDTDGSAYAQAQRLSEGGLQGDRKGDASQDLYPSGRAVVDLWDNPQLRKLVGPLLLAYPDGEGRLADGRRYWRLSNGSGDLVLEDSTMIPGVAPLPNPAPPPAGGRGSQLESPQSPADGTVGSASAQAQHVSEEGVSQVGQEDGRGAPEPSGSVLQASDAAPDRALLSFAAAPMPASAEGPDAQLGVVQPTYAPEPVTPLEFAGVDDSKDTPTGDPVLAADVSVDVFSNDFSS